MNTKDLWQALASNATTEPFFDGIFSIDTLSNIKRKPKLIICNTDPSDKPGKHWLLFFFNNDTVDYYDSLGNDINYYGKDFITFIKRFAKYYQKSEIRTQPKNTNLCGYYCLYFAYYRVKGVDMKKIIQSMNKSTNKVVNFVNRTFTFCKIYNPLFQTCIKY